MLEGKLTCENFVHSYLPNADNLNLSGGRPNCTQLLGGISWTPPKQVWLHLPADSRRKGLKTESQRL